MGNLVKTTDRINVAVGDTVVVPYGSLITNHDVCSCIDAACSEHYYRQKGMPYYKGTVVGISRKHWYGKLRDKPIYSVKLGFNLGVVVKSEKVKLVIRKSPHS